MSRCLRAGTFWTTSFLCLVAAHDANVSVFEGEDVCYCSATAANKPNCCAAKRSAGEGTGNFCGSLFSGHTCGGDTPVCCTSDVGSQCCNQGSTCSASCGGGGVGGGWSCGCVDPPPVTAACPDPISLKFGTACRCTGETCGSLPEVDTAKLQAGQALVITSEGVPGSVTYMRPEYISKKAAAENQSMMFGIDLDTLHQEIIGFGGAFTDAVAHLYSQFEPATQKKFIDAHFGEGGLGYTIGRVNMNGCDCSRMNYVYDTVANDYDLEHFCLRDDSAQDVPCGTDYKMTVIKAAQEALNRSSEKLKLFTSTWSAPTWYKNQNFTCAVNHSSFYPTGVCSPGGSEQLPTCSLEVKWSGTGATNSTWVTSHPVTRSNGQTCQSNANDNCYLTGFLREDDDAQRSWALYFSKFISAYKEAGIDIWGLTVQNEPLATTCMWPGMAYTAELQASFVAKHLGPTIRRDHPGVKIMIHDDDVTSLPEFAQAILSDASAAEFVDGVAIHWYASFGGVFEDDYPVPFVQALTRSATVNSLVDGLGFTLPNVGGGKFVKDTYDQLQEQSSDKFILGTEATNGASIGQGDWFGPSPGNWNYGYGYAHDVMWQLKNRAAGWTDWNLMLDEHGGPNGWGNFLHSTVTYHDANTFIQQPQFFHLAHFAKYVVPGSRQADLDVKCYASHEVFCQAVAFITPAGHAVVIITNDELVGIPMGSVVKGIPGVGALVNPLLSKGEGKPLSWNINCGSSFFSGSIPWKAIQTIVLPCGETEVIV